MIITRALALIGLGLVIGAADSWIRPVQLRLNSTPASSETKTPAIDEGAAAGTPHTPVNGASTAAGEEGSGRAAGSPHVLGPEITVPQAKALFDEGVIFIDARIDTEYAVDRVSGAIHLTSAMFSGSEPPQALAILDPSRPVVIYCTGGDCDASHAVGIRLQQSGFEKIHIMVDGLPGWKNAGYPVDTGPVEGQ
ncbi:MAG TPA: rhodanese-like domain-containing protein [Phycisphaerales bacterium]|nr:rhodanese-like domain-containing protein [Phycisphaerales bacterium]